jgi:hypothetical protein
VNLWDAMDRESLGHSRSLYAVHRARGLRPLLCAIETSLDMDRMGVRRCAFCAQPAMGLLCFGCAMNREAGYPVPWPEILGRLPLVGDDQAASLVIEATSGAALRGLLRVLG